MDSNKYNDNKKDYSQYIKFKIGDQAFGIDVLSSREIVSPEEITVIPDSPYFVKGVIDLRNEIVSIVSLRDRFNISADSNDGKKKEKVIIVSIESTLLGLEVSEVEEIVKISTDQIKQAPEITKKYKKDYIKGVAKLDDGLLVILAVRKIFSKKEIKKIKDIKL